jgi:hypothetical protein
LRALPDDYRTRMMDWLDESRIYREGEDGPEAAVGEGIELELARADECQVLMRMVEASKDQGGFG